MGNRASQAGFTLIELLVVMVILGLLAALVVPNYIRQGEKSKWQAARAQVELMGAALDMFRHWPTSPSLALTAPRISLPCPAMGPAA